MSVPYKSDHCPWGKSETFKQLQLHSFTLHSEAQLTQLTEKIAAQNGDSNWFSVRIWIFGTEGFHSSIGPENEKHLHRQTFSMTVSRGFWRTPPISLGWDIFYSSKGQICLTILELVTFEPVGSIFGGIFSCQLFRLLKSLVGILDGEMRVCTI